MEKKQRRFLINASVLLCFFGVVACSGSTSKVTSTEAFTQVDQPGFKLVLRSNIGQTLTYRVRVDVKGHVLERKDVAQ